MWQRGRTALLVLLTARAEPEILALVQVGGWRKAATLAPGLVKDALGQRFRNFQAFRLVPATGRKSGPVRDTGPTPWANHRSISLTGISLPVLKVQPVPFERG
jgi:hypothetical protein